MTAATIVSLKVRASPARAFDAFTGEIGTWWTPDPRFRLTPRGDGSLSFEPGVGGRLIATLASGKVFVVGEITVWQPGERLRLTWRQATFRTGQETELEVRFEPIGNETRVTVEHRGWNTIPQDHVARHGFDLVRFQRQLAGRWLANLSAMESALA